jgi:hypothetical protein
MQATSMSINLPGKCNLSCPFCISHLNPGVPGSYERLKSSVTKAQRFMERWQIDTVLVTGRGEPLLNLRQVYGIVSYFGAPHQGTPRVELQTNGVLATESVLFQLRQDGLTTLAISAASSDAKTSARVMGAEPSFDFWRVLKEAQEMRLTTRLCLNLTQEELSVVNGYVPKGELTRWLIQIASKCEEYGVKQLTLRQLGKPEIGFAGSNKAARWISKHGVSDHLMDGLRFTLSKYGVPIYTLPHGDAVYSFKGLSISLATCMAQEVEPSNKIRSLVLQPDGCVHVGWRGCPLA